MLKMTQCIKTEILLPTTFVHVIAIDLESESGINSFSCIFNVNYYTMQTTQWIQSTQCIWHIQNNPYVTFKSLEPGTYESIKIAQFIYLLTSCRNEEATVRLTPCAWELSQIFNVVNLTSVRRGSCVVYLFRDLFGEPKAFSRSIKVWMSFLFGRINICFQGLRAAFPGCWQSSLLFFNRRNSNPGKMLKMQRSCSHDDMHVFKCLFAGSAAVQSTSSEVSVVNKRSLRQTTKQQK